MPDSNTPMGRSARVMGLCSARMAIQAPSRATLRGWKPQAARSHQGLVLALHQGPEAYQAASRGRDRPHARQQVLDGLQQDVGQEGPGWAPAPWEG